MTEFPTAYQKDLEDVQSFVDTVYHDNFEEHFSRVKDLYLELKSTTVPISDESLAFILTMLPLELFAVSEALNKLRLFYELIKLKNKEEELTATTQAQKFVNDNETSFTSSQEKSDYIKQYVTSKMTEFYVMSLVYSTCISRVENEISFSRELIMGAKKIWDSRRSSEKAMPVGEVVPEDPRSTGCMPPYLGTTR